MKKLLLVLCFSMPLAFGLVWSEDPTLTKEQKEERRETNRRISEWYKKNSEKQHSIREGSSKGEENNDPATANEDALEEHPIE